MESNNDGWKFNYWRLSPKRKFVRTITVLPIGVLMYLWAYYVFNRVMPDRAAIWLIAIAVVLGGLWITQAVTTYRKWMRSEGERTEE